MNLLKETAIESIKRLPEGCLDVVVQYRSLMIPGLEK